MNFKRLQKLAEPLLDTPDTIIGKLLEFYENKSPEKEILTILKKTPKIRIDSSLNLSNSKIFDAQFNHEEISNWKKLMEIAHINAFKRIGFENLKNITKSNIAKGKKKDKGFHYLEEIDISIQGENAKKCWMSSLNLAKYLKVPIYVKFVWTKGEYKGRKGELKWNP